MEGITIRSDHTCFLYINFVFFLSFSDQNSPNVRWVVVCIIRNNSLPLVFRLLSLFSFFLRAVWCGGGDEVCDIKFVFPIQLKFWFHKRHNTFCVWLVCSLYSAFRRFLSYFLMRLFLYKIKKHSTTLLAKLVPISQSTSLVCRSICTIFRFFQFGHCGQITCVPLQPSRRWIRRGVESSRVE